MWLEERKAGLRNSQTLNKSPSQHQRLNTQECGMQAAERRVSLELPRARQPKTSTSLGCESELRPALPPKTGCPLAGHIVCLPFPRGEPLRPYAIPALTFFP